MGKDAGSTMTEPRNTIIESLGVYLPRKMVTSREVLATCRKKISFPMEELTGIRSTQRAGDDEFAIDLAKKAVSDCLSRSCCEPKDIDLIVCCNISRYDAPGFHYMFEPSTAIQLKKYFGFESAMAFDVSNACPGMFTGTMIVDRLIKMGAIKRGLVVSGEYISHLTRTAQLELERVRDPRLACLTLGDAGAALILEKARDDTVGFHRIELYTESCFSELCTAKVTAQKHGGAIMYTDAARLGPLAAVRAMAHSLATLKKHGWSVDAVQHLIPHQTSRKTFVDMANELNRMFKKEGWAETIIVDNLAHRGNTASTSHFVAVMDHIANGRIQTGDNVVFSIAGSGLTVGTALFTFDDLPERVCRGQRRRRSPEPERTEIHGVAISALRLDPVVIQSVGIVPLNWTGRRETIALAKHAMERCLDKSVVEKNDVGLLIFCGVYRTDFVCEPAVAALIAGAIDINAKG